MQLVANVGFPIVVAAWFLYKLHPDLVALTLAMRELTLAVRDALDRGLPPTRGQGPGPERPRP